MQPLTVIAVMLMVACGVYVRLTHEQLTGQLRRQLKIERRTPWQWAKDLFGA